MTREERRGESSLWSSMFLSAPTSMVAATAAAVTEKKGSRLVGVVHHRVNWRCSGHSVNPGRSITAKRSRCSSSKRASPPPRASPCFYVRRRRGSLSLSLSFHTDGRGATPFRGCRPSKKKARPPRAYRRERTGCLMATITQRIEWAARGFSRARHDLRA